MDRPKVYVLRGGAPEKVGLTGALYDAIKLDGKNLSDLNPDFVKHELLMGNYFLPSEENDYSVLPMYEGINNTHILLCKNKDGSFKSRDDVRKDAPLYKNWKCSALYYPHTEFLPNYKVKYYSDKVYKTTNESGSRGVLVKPSIDAWNVFKGTHPDDEVFLVQDAVDESLKGYFSLDLQIKDGVLLGYAFVDIPAGSYPRWIKGRIRRTEVTDKLVADVADYLISNGYPTGFFNIDGTSNNWESDFTMYEINFRYSGIGNVLRCMNIDIIHQFIYGIPYSIPYGVYDYQYSYTPVLLPSN